VHVIAATGGENTPKRRKSGNKVYVTAIIKRFLKKFENSVIFCLSQSYLLYNAL
jgi:hypothetical protein